MTAFYLYLFECTQKGMPGFEEFQGEFNKENHLLQLFRQVPSLPLPCMFPSFLCGLLSDMFPLLFSSVNVHLDSQSIDRNSASIVTLCDLLIHVVRIE